MLHRFSTSPQTGVVEGHRFHLQLGVCSFWIVNCAASSSFVVSMGGVLSGRKGSGSDTRNISTSGTPSTGYTSTNTTSTSTSSGFHLSSALIEKQLMKTAKRDMPVEVTHRRRSTLMAWSRNSLVRRQRITASMVAPLKSWRGGSVNLASDGFSASLTVQMQGSSSVLFLLKNVLMLRGHGSGLSLK